jgi:hypothetical protein
MMKTMVEAGDCAAPGGGTETYKPGNDTMSRHGAAKLARRLEDYWHARGFLSVRFWAEPYKERFDKIGSYEIYRVRTNLVNGLPREAVQKKKS